MTDVDQRAFTSPFRDLLGLRITSWTPGRCVVETETSPPLTNFAGSIAGPVVAAMIDMSAVLAGCFRPEPEEPRKAISVTLSVSFVGLARAGKITAVAESVGGGRRLYASRVEVTDEDGTVLAIGQCTCRYID